MRSLIWRTFNSEPEVRLKVEFCTEEDDGAALALALLLAFGAADAEALPVSFLARFGAADAGRDLIHSQNLIASNLIKLNVTPYSNPN